MKKIEFLSMSPGSLFSSVWRGPSLFWYYRKPITIEYRKCGFKQNLLHRILFGKMPNQTIVRHYGDEYKWIFENNITYPEYDYKENIVDICGFVKQKGVDAAYMAESKVFDCFNMIVKSCPVDNVVVFGYEFEIENGMIKPEVIKHGLHGSETSAYITCGFAGY
jgi:hypothetical protein